ncbi:HIT domain-containing protein [Ruegeria sediminis]|uniref:HIT domain-containing protein n=1 Tax=Ruegeria sediminis TaxID=2583820 RepID=A0ABY2WU28_9RHOB|nr:HIT domain-containing protein [Ruegeria sediminis]TMV05508.1 HIT domain-containing protein [Ruegeria sediminis]
MADDCIFCRIAAGELPAQTVFEDDLVIAFLDLHPIREGHTLIIPRQHCPWFEDLPAVTAARIMEIGQTLARGMKAEWNVPRVAFFFTGIHVPHAHAHVVPMHHDHDVTSSVYLQEGPDRFTLPPSPGQDSLARTALKLRKHL